MRTRLFVLLGALLVSSCASGNVPNQAISNVSPNARHVSNETVGVHSILGEYVINTVKITHGFIADCTLRKDGGDAKGCDVVSTFTGKVTSSTFTMYTGHRAEGCAVAEGHYKGNITKNEVIPITFKAINLNCWD
jgi:hypothetical protein